MEGRQRQWRRRTAVRFGRPAPIILESRAPTDGTDRFVPSTSRPSPDVPRSSETETLLGGLSASLSSTLWRFDLSSEWNLGGKQLN